MADWVVDTNVLLVATRAQLGRPPRALAQRGEDVPVTGAAELEAVHAWVKELRRSPDHLVLDVPHKLLQGEYANKLDKSEYGRMVVAEKLSRGQCRFVDVATDADGHGVISHEAGGEVFDLADRKMVAAALAADAPLVNACDTDWCDLEARGTLDRLGVRVQHLLEPWCRAEWERKKGA
ncbi:MAG: hypothetical protein IT374_12970 [Polyangiaceae bacterium]|nr:hypothetical protein [Polyangiaceae bacterium]